jgi:hypothetical protein
MRSTLMLGLATVAIGLLAATAAHAKTCKDAISAQARSAAQVSDESRERRAKDKAIANWGKRARDTYGWQYRFWTKAEEQKVECGGTAKAKHCSVSAKPCSLF